MSPLTNHAWIALCLASIFICFKTEASPLATLPKPSAAENPQVINAFPSFNIDDVKDAEPMPKIIIARSADADDNSVDDDDDNENKSNKTEKPNSDNSEEIFPDDNKNHHHQNHHAHGSHGGLGPVKHLLNTVRDRVHGGGGGMLGGLGNILGGINHRANTPHESPIETEEDRTMINSSTGLHVLEVLGTLFGLLWGFLSNIPALFASSSSGLSGGGQ